MCVCVCVCVCVSLSLSLSFSLYICLYVCMCVYVKRLFLPGCCLLIAPSPPAHCPYTDNGEVGRCPVQNCSSYYGGLILVVREASSSMEVQTYRMQYSMYVLYVSYVSYLCGYTPHVVRCPTVRTGKYVPSSTFVLFL